MSEVNTARLACVIVMAMATVMSAVGATWPVFLGWTIANALIWAFWYAWERQP